jgi:type II secretory pathway component GspD/PulD (secretin)
MIEALILDLKLTDEDQLGITWEMVHKERPERSILQRLSLTSATSPASGVIKYGKSLIPAATFNLLIEMWKSQGRVEILANPRIATMDNLPAHIELLERIPYQSESQSTEGGTVVRTIQFKDAGIKLTVTPHVTNKDDNIMINISTEQSFRSGFVETQPIIDSRKAETTLMVKDGETIAIGGLKRKQDAITIEKIPVLGDIPVLGQLFRRKVSAITDTELLIFVTPYLREQNLSPDEEEKLEKYRDKLLSATEKEEKPQEKLSDLPEEEKSEKIDEELLGSTWKEEQIEKPKEQLLGVPVKEEKADKPKEQLSGATEKHKIVLRDVVIAEALVEALDKVSKKPSVKETKR